MTPTENRPSMERIRISADSLADLAIFLSGFKERRGNLRPLGTVTLDNLWNTVHYLQGDVRYFAERDEK